jgi:hypothetical protein
MKAGSFFKIPVSREALTIMFGDMAESNTINDKYEPKIKYDFYYF